MTLSRSLLVGLIVSAALNVFLIGGLAGVAWVRLFSPPPAALSPAPQPAPPTPVVAPPPGQPPEQPAARRQAGAGSAPPTSPAPVAERTARPPLWTAGEGLSPESRRALRQALHAANQKNQPISRQARVERQAALAALRSSSYDPAEVGRRLAAARALDIQARGNVEAALAAYAATLSPAERAVLAEGLSRIYAPRQRLLQRGVE
ncbi:periplasmic heavy metal sensor [Caulobacter sp.]|uniref:periplasmic heavy metal sensor n=1 Tax=Caulobacter sp. TaxID=78 RepID=UPI002B48ECCC|nr:periplasmic heavy metal sensor [Caulobacter sp.]HJV41545.1 periplasmic heavy metal sensor [Caulobacter sp.]